MNSWGRVQRVDGPAPGTVALQLYHPDAGRRYLVLEPSGARWHRERPRGLRADGFVRRLRKLLVGAVVTRLERGDQGPRIVFRTRDSDAMLAIEGTDAVLRRLPDGRPLAARHRVGTRTIEPGAAIAPEALAVIEDAQRPLEDGERRELRRRLRALRKRTARKLEAIAGDAARAERAPALRHEAELITAHLSRFEPGSSTLQVLDWATEPPTPRQLEIDPRRGPAGMAQALFRRAKRFERGAAVAAERAKSVEADLQRLDEALATFEDRTTPELREVLDALAPRTASLHGTPKHARRERLPYRRFLGHGGAPVLVGRGARENDALTLSARPHDHWLHARGARGAHVIVPLERSRTIGPELLADAAMLAAHFSERRNDEVVEVQHTPRRYVRKPRGSAPGAVRVDRERVIAVRMAPERLRWLLARER